MNIVPPVLFLTFAGFLPNDCDAMHRPNRMGYPILQPEVSGSIVVTSHQDLKFKSEFMMDAVGQTEPSYLRERMTENYERYRACLITCPYVVHKSYYLFSLPASEEGYIERTYVPKSVEVMAFDVQYYEFEGNWHEYDPAHPPQHPTSTEYARLYITIPNTKQVLHKLFKEIPAPAGVDYDGVRNAAYLRIQDKIAAQRARLAAMPSRTWE